MLADNKQYKELLAKLRNEKSLFTTTGKLNSALIRREYFLKSELCKHISEATSFLPNDAPISERIYCIENDVTQRKMCVCGRELRFITNTVGYLPSCKKCKRKVATTWKSSSESIIKNIKREKTDLYNYIQDISTPEASHDEVVDFINDRSKNAAESQKWVTRTDYKHNKHILKKVISMTCYMQWTTEEYNWANRMYNIINNMHEDNMCVVCNVTKTRFVNFLRGYSNCCSNRECVQAFGCKNRVLNHVENIRPVIDQQGFNLLVDQNYRGGNHSKTDLLCRKCNTVISCNILNGGWKHIRCYVCHGNSGMSFEEKTVVEFIKQHDQNVQENHKVFANSHKEVDIYIPNRSLAIEYNGIHWHSFGTSYPNNISQMCKNKNNHFKKHELCEQHGIKLLQINSFEWLNEHKQRIWKSIIENCLNVSQKIHARKCTVVEISSKESNDFLNLNHLQGMSNAKVCLGLKHNDVLVAVMTFSKPRFNKSYQWELVRFCNLLNHAVVGGASKLMKYFVTKHHPQSLISYADIRYSNGDMYKKLGFKFIKHTPPSYIYTLGGKILSRFSTQKHKLSKLLTSYDSSKTELQNMLDNGYRKMWDAGTMLFEYIC